MAKVIKRGDRHIKDSKAKYTCRKCDSVIEFTRSDIRGDHRDGDYVKCPVCSEFINSNVVFKKLPSP